MVDPDGRELHFTHCVMLSDETPNAPLPLARCLLSDRTRCAVWPVANHLPLSSLPIYPTTPTKHPRIDNAAASSSFGPAFKCANEGNLLSGSQVHRGLNPAVLEPISAPFALALASVT